MEMKELICIGCPMGCMLTAAWENGQVGKVTGNTCKRGEVYARKELTAPTRIVTSSVKVEGACGNVTFASCKTASDVPKDKIFDVIRSLKGVTVKAPVHIGDVIVPDAGGTGVSVISTREVI